MFRLFRKKRISFKNQINKFAELGITLNSGVELEDLLEENSEQSYESEPFDLLLLTLGGEIFKEEHFLIPSDNIWHFDTECIEDHGDYKAIIERLKKLTNLDIHNIKDYIDIENEQAWVSFDYQNKTIKWDLNINDDWVDPEIFDKFTNLISKESDKTIVMASLGQDCLIAYMNEEKQKELNKLVKYNFQ
ncbi:hypothetical protein ACFPPD_21560 [Cohnella suwonensis]|uniref:Uncharacterized protein n=1 Tax=Cohnella suwonensis TaxID=696072 RepID=A0ABW0M181_9BACL